jgi:hypothetical protein
MDLMCEVCALVVNEVVLFCADFCEPGTPFPSRSISAAVFGRRPCSMASRKRLVFVVFSLSSKPVWRGSRKVWRHIGRGSSSGTPRKADPICVVFVSWVGVARTCRRSVCCWPFLFWGVEWMGEAGVLLLRARESLLWQRRIVKYLEIWVKCVGTSL